MAFDLKIDSAFEAEVLKRASELVNQGEEEGVLNNSNYGELRVYINKKPPTHLFFIIGPESISELAGKKIYVGGEEA